MATIKRNNVVLKRGILQSGTGSFSDINVSKNGVLKFKKQVRLSKSRK